jgi:hypothetical protein
VNELRSLEHLTEELENVAGKLRAGALQPDEAADLVERCAQLAGQLGSEVDARARGATETEGQERLL